MREYFKTRLGNIYGRTRLLATIPLTQHFAAGLVAREIMRWAVPVSLAATKGIAIAFFSSAY